jgi:hypothetical protein
MLFDSFAPDARMLLLFLPLLHLWNDFSALTAFSNTTSPFARSKALRTLRHFRRTF